MHLLRRGCCQIPYCITSSLILPDVIPVSPVFEDAVFQLIMVGFNKFFGQRLFEGLQHLIEHFKMPGHFFYVFCPVDHTLGRGYCSCFKKGCSIILGQSTTFNPVRIIGEFPLKVPVNPASVLPLIFRSHQFNQCIHTQLLYYLSHRLRPIDLIHFVFWILNRDFFTPVLIFR